MGGAAIAPGVDQGRGHLYTGRTTFYVICVALSAGSAGLIFGYDNGVTGGVITQPDFQRRFFPETLGESDGTAYCKYNDHLLQLFTSSLFIAGAIAAVIGMWTCKHWGRKATMMMGSICFLVGTALVASAFNVGQLVVGRIVLGFGVGFACQAAPLYLSEMAPFRMRGAMNFLFQLAVTIGILAAQLINYGTQYLQPWGWRLSLALGAVPALILLLSSLLLPDTPNSLVQRGRPEEGLRVLQRVRGVEDVSVEMDDITHAVHVTNAIANPYKTILKRRYRPQLIIPIVIPIIQQFTGINAIMFYAPQLFESIGSGSSAALLNTVIIGAVNVGSTVIALLLVDRVGRRKLFQEAGVQMFIAEIIVGALIAAGMGVDGTGTLSKPMAQAIIAFICIYVSAFAWSWGPLGWLVPTEIQPLETRPAGTALNTCVNLLATFIIGQTFLSMLCSMKFGVFFFFAGFVLIGTLFTIFFVPETRHVPIEEVEEVRIGRHWFWKRVIGPRPPVIPTTAKQIGSPHQGGVNMVPMTGASSPISTGTNSATDSPIKGNNGINNGVARY